MPVNPSALALPDDAVEVGRIAGAWGVKGWIRVLPYAEIPEALFATKRWLLRPPEGPAPLPPGGWPDVLRVSQAREHGDAIVAGIHDLTDRDAAEALKGGRLFVPRSSFPTAGDGEYYWVDLIGLDVRNRAGEALGQVVGLLDTGAHSVLRVRPAINEHDPSDAPERLIPFVGAYIDSVDLQGRSIVVDWGLDY